MANITNAEREARQAVTELTEGGKWADLQSKDVPHGITSWVEESLKAGVGLDQIRKSLDIPTNNDPRWKKIMLALKTGARVDSTAIFLTWMERNEQIAERVFQMTKEMLDNQRPMSKLLMEGIGAMATLQEKTIKMGKELGVFQEQQAGGSGSGVTIVVQTNIPHPKKEEIVVHQENQREKNKKLLEKYRPEDK